jgi:hypothetical protein
VEATKIQNGSFKGCVSRRHAFHVVRSRTAKSVLEIERVGSLSEGALESAGSLNKVVADIVVRLGADVGHSSDVLQGKKQAKNCTLVPADSQDGPEACQRA